MRAWRRIIKPGDLFVDLGGDVGCYALWAGDSGAQVIAIEPNPEAAEKLLKNVRMNGSPIEVRQHGLGAEVGHLAMTRNEGTRNHIVFGKDNRVGIIEIDKLDNVLGPVCGWCPKIDVEGAERPLPSLPGYQKPGSG